MNDDWDHGTWRNRWRYHLDGLRYCAFYRCDVAWGCCDGEGMGFDLRGGVRVVVYAASVYVTVVV